MEKRYSRRTRQRRVILEIVKGTATHPTAEWIFTRARRRMPNISLGTVYRNLNILEGEGEILKLALSIAAARFDGNADPHDHLRCYQCGVVMDLEPFLAPDLKGKIADLHHFINIRHNLIFSGLCPRCQGLNG